MGKITYRPDLNHETALENYGGYTDVSGVLFVFDPAPREQVRFWESAIILGCQFDRFGADLGLSYAQIDETILKIALPFVGHEDLTLTSVAGAWVDDGIVTHEGSIVLQKPGVSDLLLPALAERLRVELRQKSVLIALSTGQAGFIEE